MDDNNIVNLFWERSEKAIGETSLKYGRYCYSIAYNILRNNEDSEECVNDTYINAWNSIPPHRPNNFSTFLGKITRNLSLNKYEKNNASKRGGGQIPLILDELEECIPSVKNVEDEIDNLMLHAALNNFLIELIPENRIIFLQRYWYMCSVKEIAKEHNSTESRIKMILFRLRGDLKLFLEKKGIML